MERVENPRNITLMTFKLSQEHNFVKTLLYEDVSSYCTFDKLFKMFIFTSKNFRIQKVRYNRFNAILSSFRQDGRRIFLYLKSRWIVIDHGGGSIAAIDLKHTA